ncbi:MAG: 3-phosphoshikimate 1-carboxyvinyltransferase [Spirochaetaceae bacterium]|nr:3-phosphoshikimate 1-carboxyvinyltransferase [Spirochaetaceae bacterium]
MKQPAAVAHYVNTFYTTAMNTIITPRHFSGSIHVPASKSHTIRRLLLATFTKGTSFIDFPLASLDIRSCIKVCTELGAKIIEESERLTVIGRGRHASPPAVLDVGNSGTTLFLALAFAALGTEPIAFTGDEQIKRRSAAPLLNALSGLGVSVSSEQGCVPITVRGPWKGGSVVLSCPTSQYLSALLLAAPLSPVDTATELEIPFLNEKPYIDLTLSYLNQQNIDYKAALDYSWFYIPGGAHYQPLNGTVPGDFSSAAFPACAAAITGGPVTLFYLDPHDRQGDKYIFTLLEQMGCTVIWDRTRVTISRSGPLHAGTFDLNATPDLLPAMAAVAAFAVGRTALVNVAHARIKETDRIAVMMQELGKLGLVCEERPDALIIHGTGSLEGGIVDGRKDHRIVMALAAAALGAKAPVEIIGTEAADVTYPGFIALAAGAVPDDCP